MLAATGGTQVELVDTLQAVEGLPGLANIYPQLGGEISINLDQGQDVSVLEATIGECNNGSENFHELNAKAKTAKVHRASQASIKLSGSGNSVFAKNINDGGCEAHINASGGKNCALLRDYTSEQREAMTETTRIAFQKTAESFPGTKVLLVEKFGNFKKKEHTQRDGTPVVTMEGVIEERMVVLSVVVKHLSLAPGDTSALLSIVEGREALKAAGERALGWKEGELDLGGLLANYNEAGRIKGVLDFMEILVTAEQESAEYRENLDATKTARMVEMVNELRGEQSLERVLPRVEKIAALWMPRGYTAKNRSDGGERERESEREGNLLFVCLSTSLGCCGYCCCPRNLVASLVTHAHTHLPSAIGNPQGGTTAPRFAGLLLCVRTRAIDHRQEQQLRPHRGRDRGGRDGARGGRFCSLGRCRHRGSSSKGEGGP